MQIHGLLLDPPEYLQTAKVFDLLLAVPKYGRVKVNRILTHCRISPSKTIGGLSQRQRNELVATCAARAIAPPVLVITGPSGVGKGTLIRGLLERMPGLRAVASRPPRARRARGRSDGVDYWFLSHGEFERRVEAGEFVEHAEYAGNRYGTLRSELERRAGGDRAGDRRPGRAPGARDPARGRLRSSSPRRRWTFCASAWRGGDRTRPSR